MHCLIYLTVVRKAINDNNISLFTQSLNSVFIEFFGIRNPFKALVFILMGTDKDGVIYKQKINFFIECLKNVTKRYVT